MNKDSTSFEQIMQCKSKEFKCPCGKAYLSNAALFTHVKQKHNGTPPGDVSKPKNVYAKRGRPTIYNQKIKRQELQKERQQILQTRQLIQEKKIGSTIDQIANLEFQKLFLLVRQISVPQTINQKIWTEVPAFTQLYQYINSPQDFQDMTDFKYPGIRMGIGLAQFLKIVSLRVQIWQFQQIIVLFVLLLQYVFDENNKKEVIHQAPVQFLVEYINLFTNDQLQHCLDDYELHHLWIGKKSNVVKTLYCFYHWLVSKKYTEYRVTLAGNQLDDLLF